MIPNRAVVAAAIPTAMTVIAMVIVIMVVIAIMIVMVVMMEKAEAPVVQPDKAVARIEIVVERRTESADARIVRPIAFPLVAPPIAADPVEIVALRVAIVERSAIPLAVEIDGTIGYRIVPEIIRTAQAVAISAALVRKSDAAARAVAETKALGVRRRARKQ